MNKAQHNTLNGAPKRKVWLDIFQSVKTGIGWKILHYCVIDQSVIQRNWVNLAWSWISGNFWSCFVRKFFVKAGFRARLGTSWISLLVHFHTKILNLWVLTVLLIQKWVWHSCPRSRFKHTLPSIIYSPIKLPLFWDMNLAQYDRILLPVVGYISHW